jgi:hypothetical protein
MLHPNTTILPTNKKEILIKCEEYLESQKFGVFFYYVKSKEINQIFDSYSHCPCLKI